jgi:hypothetical protein
VAWTNDHPLVKTVLNVAYATMLPQTALTVILLGFTNARKPLEIFVRRMMLCGLITFVCFMLFPAVGPFNSFGFLPSPDQAHYMQSLTALRSGTLHSLDFGSVDGLITFPSFHTIWAILIVAACWKTRIRIPVLILNVLVILSTMTTGWHYLADVVGGIVVCLVVCMLTPVEEENARS